MSNLQKQQRIQSSPTFDTIKNLVCFLCPYKDQSMHQSIHHLDHSLAEACTTNIMADASIVDELDIDIKSLAPRSSSNINLDTGESSQLPYDDDLDPDQSTSRRCQSSRRDPTEFYADEEGVVGVEQYPMGRRSSTKSKASSTTTATAESSFHDLSPVSCKKKTKAKRRTSESAEFSLGISHHSEDLESSLANRLGAVALEEACERKAQLCCGSCCDLIKGTVIANTIQIVYLIILVNAILPNTYVEAVAVISAQAKRWGHIFGGAGILFSAAGIWGACRFQKYPVLATGLWSMFQLVYSIVRKELALVPFAFFFAYPNFHLLLATTTKGRNDIVAVPTGRVTTIVFVAKTEAVPSYTILIQV